MMEQAIEIRPVGLEDFEDIYRFINALEKITYDPEKQREILRTNVSHPDNIYLIALIEGRAVGFISCHVQSLLHHNGLVGEIQEVYVEEQYRSLGVGKQLIDQVKALAKARHLVQLEVTSSHKRVDAHRFYERENFRHTHKKFVYKLE